MDFSEFARLPDKERIGIFEFKAHAELQDKNWKDPAPPLVNTYALFANFMPGEVVEVKANGIDYERKDSALACDGDPGSFFWDHEAQILYVHMVDSDGPGAMVAGRYKYVLNAYFWSCHTLEQPSLWLYGRKAVVFAPPGCLYDAYYWPDIVENGIKNIVQSVEEFHIGGLSHDSCEVTLANNGYWYWFLAHFFFENAESYVRVGAKGSDYADLAVAFYGLAKKVNYGDDTAIFVLSDLGVGILKNIPVSLYTLDQWPDMEQGLEGKPKPIPWGECASCKPPSVSTAFWIYQYCDEAYAPPEALDAVYKDGALLVEGVDYLKNLAAGRFRLLADPGDSEITCDVRGVKCDMVTGLYSYLAADLLYFLLVTVNGQDPLRIDGPSFLNLKALRTQRLGYFMSEVMHSIDFIKKLMISAVFQFRSTLDGKYSAIVYESAIPSGTPVLQQEELGELRKETDVERVCHSVTLKYGFIHSANKFLAVKKSDATVGYRYSQYEDIELESILTDQPEAETLCQLHLDLLRMSGKYVEGVIPATGLDRLPADRVILYKEVLTDGNKTIKVFDGDVYRLLSLDKSIELCTAEVRGLLDAISLGEYHTDEAHQDLYQDSHVDEPHLDDPHVDYRDYLDVPHSDHIDHSDFHEDHSDHADHLDLGPYEDYTDYQDIPYSDHEDHGDAPYQDHTDYDDVPHGDGPHADQHVDYHLDEPHYDSWY